MWRTFQYLLISAAVLASNSAAIVESEAQPLLRGQLGSRGRPVIVLVHGRAQGGRDYADVSREWDTAFEQGLKDAGFTGLAELLDEEDVYLIWYGDLYRPEDPSYRADPTCTGSEHTAPSATTLDRRIERRGLSMSERARRQAISLFVGGTKSSTFLRTRLEDTYHFFSDAVRRCTTTRRLRVFLDDARRGDRPVILITHSMGALVAYDALRNRYQADEYPVRTWITMGTQLGLPYVMQQFDGISTRERAPVPASVASWVNIKNRRDNLAFSMRPFFCAIQNGQCVLATGATARPVEMRIDATFGRRENPRRNPHWIGNYLRHRTTATAIATAWCNAFRTGAPPQCDAVRRTNLFDIPDEW